MARRRRYWRAYHDSGWDSGWGSGWGHDPGCGPGGCGDGYGGHHGHHGHHGPWSGGWHGPGAGGGYGRGGMGGRWWRGGLSMMMRRLQLTPDQQTVVREELEQLGRTLREHRQEWHASRRDVAAALRTESFDETVMGELFGRHDERLTEVRKAVMEALGRIHAVLDDTQRQRLAELVDRGAGPWHPFRGDMV
ncbi:periplasmic heavy metal sensor [Paraliomyxa miuraensis]|nr:periplasmic heavy metal sensor [Paraliomyxa miuraensis]